MSSLECSPPSQSWYDDALWLRLKRGEEWELPGHSDSDSAVDALQTSFETVCRPESVVCLDTVKISLLLGFLEIGSILHFSWLTIKSPSNKLCKSVAGLSIAWCLLVAFSLFVLNEPVNWTSPYTFRSFLFHFIRDLIGNKISIFQFIYSLRRLVHYYRSISDLWHSPQIYCIFLVQCGLHFPGSTATELLNKKLVTLCIRPSIRVSFMTLTRQCSHFRSSSS